MSGPYRRCSRAGGPTGLQLWETAQPDRSLGGRALCCEAAQSRPNLRHEFGAGRVRDLRQDDPLPARGDVGDVVDRDEHETAAQDAGADDEGVRLIGSSPEHDGLDEAEAAIGGVDPEALAATEPV